MSGTSVKILASGQSEIRSFLSGPALTPLRMISEVKKLAADWTYDVVPIGYLQHRELPPNLHFTVSNPNIAFDDLKLESSTVPRPCRSRTRQSSWVSSYGFGSANAPVVISEYRKPRFPIAGLDCQAAVAARRRAPFTRQDLCDGCVLPLAP
jgi:hypothetical protein